MRSGAVWTAILASAVFLAAAAAGYWVDRRRPDSAPANEVSPKLLAAARAARESGAYAKEAKLLQQVPEDNAFGAESRLLLGKALWKLNRWDAAEQAWNRALELDPQVPEAGSSLLKFYYVQHRVYEAEELALRLYPVEPDARDRTLLLLELVRIDNERLTAGETAVRLEPVLAAEPENYHAMRTLGFSYCGLCPQPKVTLGAEYHHYCQGAK